MTFPDYLARASLTRMSHVMAVMVPESPINVYRILLRIHNLLHEGVKTDQILGFLPKSKEEETSEGS